MAKEQPSWLSIIGASLIPTLFFALPEIPTGNQNIYFGITPYLTSLLISTFALFLSSLLLASVALKIYIKKRGALRLIRIAFIAIILSLAVKTILIIGNTPWDSIILDFLIQDPSFAFKVIWLTIPFTGSLLLLLLIKDCNLNKLARFLGALGFSFLLIAGYRIGYVAKNFNTARWENNIKTSSHNQNNRKVIWVVFDEFDPELAFTKNNLAKLPNFKSLLNTGVSHSKMYPPSNATITSIPSMLMGVPTLGNEYKGVASLEVKTYTNTSIPFTYENTIFSRIKAHNANSAILGFYNPYCETFNEIKCKSYPMTSKFRWYSGIIHAYTHRKLLELSDKENKLKASEIDSMAYITEQQLSLLPQFLLNKEIDFSFIHLNIPHLPAYYAHKLFKKNAGDDSSNYNLNLQLADYTLNLIQTKIQQIENKKTLLILSSDHWFRVRDKSTQHPALFIAKISDDNEVIDLSEATSSIYIEGIVNKFLGSEITSHKDIQKYFDNKTFHNTFIQSNEIKQE